MHTKTVRWQPLLTLAVTFSLSTGCTFAMPSENESKIQPPSPTLGAPLHFKRHNFQAFCYNAIGCHITYNGHQFLPLFGEPNPDSYVSPPPSSPNYRDKWPGRGHMSIPNFPGPVQVSWKSMDETEHHASIDFSSIFEDGLIWHKVPKSDMADFFSGPYAGSPDIFVEVNDRTVSVYMSMFIPTKSEQIPGNSHSSFRNDVLLVWTKTY